MVVILKKSVKHLCDKNYVKINIFFRTLNVNQFKDEKKIET